MKRFRPIGASGVAFILCGAALAALGGSSSALPTPPLAAAAVVAPAAGATMILSGSSSANSAPRITSGPVPLAVVGQPFAFRPQATDADGDRLTFAVSNPPAWTSFDPSSGTLFGTPQLSDVGQHGNVVISVTDGINKVALPEFSVTVMQTRKNHYGHYFATRYEDTPADAAMLCEQPGVSGVVWRRPWGSVEPSAGTYDFGTFDQVLGAIAGSRNPQCQLWLFVEFKSFANSPAKNPCPVYLQAQHSGLNSYGNGAATCFMWEPEVASAYGAMMKAAAARFDANPRVEGLIIQESSLGFNQSHSQDVADGGTYTATAWRDALIQIIGQCAAAFRTSRCMSFLNFLRGGQSYLNDISTAISAVPGNQVCFSGPDVLPNSPALYNGSDKVYQVLVRHNGCRSNSAQNDSYEIPDCGPGCVFHFAVSGSLGTFPSATPFSGGLCVNSYLFWNHRTLKSATGLDWTSALPVIAANPYGPGWYGQCSGSSGPP